MPTDLRLIAALLVLVALPSPAPAESPDAAGDEPHADAAGDDLTADELARRVADKTGDPTAVDKLAFTFVVDAGGEQKVRRRHVWWPKKGELEVTRGEATVRFRRLHTHSPTELTDAPDEHADTWEKIAPDADPEDAAEAWSWFINDSYWLLAPAKLLDPGVERHLDDRGRLVLTFDDVGLTPGDRYTLTIDRDRRVVTRWHYDLQGGREGTFLWKDYRSFGPLYLSTRRVAPDRDPKTVIRFEKIEVTADASP